MIFDFVICKRPCFYAPLNALASYASIFVIRRKNRLVFLLKLIYDSAR